MRRTHRLLAKVGAGLLALWLLAACSADMDEGGSQSMCGDWCWGGQTGSLMPACGLTPNTTMRGVPASASGFVVSSAACGDARLLDALTVRDASGQAIPFNAEQLPNGEILIQPANGLTSGRYTVSVQAGGDDEDGGVDPMTDAGAPVSTPIWQQTVTVQPGRPLPQLFGTVGRQQNGCEPLIELRPDAEVLPFLGLISVEVQVNDGAPQTLIETGTTLLFEYGVARVELPEGLLAGLPDGEHTLHIVVRLAGEVMPLETFMMTLTVPCGGSGDAFQQDASEADGGCSAVIPRGADASESLAGAAFALIAIALRRRRRAAR